MTFTPVEIIAAGIVIASIVKILIIFTNKDQWVEWTEKVYDRPDVMRPVLIVLAVVVFYYLLQEMSIVQIFAVMGFVALIVSIEMMDYPEAIKDITRKTREQELTVSQHIYMIIWFGLAVWAFIQLFF